MTDRESWDLAVAAVAGEFAALSPSRRALLAELTLAATACKKELNAVVTAVSAAEICAACGGGCCETGKYHVTVVDLLVYLVEGKELFTPRYDQGMCPYLGAQGCLMAPAYRPYNCVTFNCERVERLLMQAEKERLASLERELRSLYGRFEELCGNRFMGGLLMNCERDLIGERGSILRAGEQ
ncbi:MAG: hypothetical protein NDI77_11785 [Geobacteraceae bacterium]|nr:hypothetical protein [Geobacteraceae bacterium]